MNKSNLIVKKENLEGLCDRCNNPIPPSGGIIKSLGMKILVELGFEPTPQSGMFEILGKRMEKKDYQDFLLMRILKTELLNKKWEILHFVLLALMRH